MLISTLVYLTIFSLRVLIENGGGGVTKSALDRGRVYRCFGYRTSLKWNLMAGCTLSGSLSQNMSLEICVIFMNKL